MTNFNFSNEVYVAFLDVLGFSQLVNNNSPYKVAEIYQCVFRGVVDMSLAEVAQVQQDSPWDINESGESVPNLKNTKLNSVALFDSIIFWTSTNKTSDLITLMATVRNLMAKLLYFGLPVRGAITCGIVTFNGGQIPAGSTIIHYQLLGKPLVEAVRLEKMQNWSGCALHDNVIKKYSPNDISIFEQHSMIIKYKVPMKKYTSVGIKTWGEERYVINWPAGIPDGSKSNVDPNKIRAAFRDHGKYTEVDDGIEQKINNTMRFFNDMHAITTMIS